MTAADSDVREVERMFAVNVLGPMRMVHHFHRMVVEVKGTVVNIGSVGGIVPYIYGGGSVWIEHLAIRLTREQQATMLVKRLFIIMGIP